MLAEDKRRELIAEVRDEFLPHSNDVWACDLAARLADALEAATRVPVQGEPNGDRERIAAILQLRHPGNMYSTCERDADAILALIREHVTRG